MKHISKVVLLVLLSVLAIPTWAQSTQGKEFWVSSSLVCSPDKATPTPYIAISAEKACTVQIQGGVNNAINITQQVAAGSWNEFGNGTTSQTNPTQGMIKVPMDASAWYPTAMSNANNVYTLAGQKNMYGLHITATEDISVYVILSSLHSMDASNILPLTALGSEYYTQDYWSKVKSDFADAVGLTTILGTEDNTEVEIIPNGDTFDGHQSGQLYTITLNKGQTYYMVTKKGDRLAGTHIRAKQGRKIAVYCGVPITNIPTGIAARDCLFEQPMPIEYWGTQFIVTRSLEKNGNLIGITATTNGTEIKVDGYTQAYIGEGETYYIMLQSAGDPNGNKAGDSPIDLVVTADVAFIETSCPCAVYSYDTGNSYKGKTVDEIVGGKGDPSSVWVSPVQQKINRITFGTCYTSKTEDHFLNVVTETATCQNTKLTALYGATQLDKTSLLVWQPVPGNPTYSYARAKIGDSSTKNYSVFRLENAHGVIATVYGNGEDESYAYSAGSAAVEQGVLVDGETFTDGYRSNTKFCIDTELSFDAKVGTDEISRVDWDFGDGTTEYYGLPQTSHPYTTPGWYDVTASLWGHQVCTTEDNVQLGTVHFTFRVVRPDTIIQTPQHHCFDLDGRLDGIGDPYTEQQIADSIALGGTRYEQADCSSDVYVIPVSYGRETIEELDTITGYDQARGYNDSIYYASTDVIDTIEAPENSKKCTIYRKYYVRVITCLDLKFHNDSAAQHICPTNSLTIDYEKIKGDIKSVRFVVPGYVDDTIVMSNANTRTGSVMLPTEAITKPGIYKGQIIVEDLFCETKTHTIDIAVYYPEDIVKYKFNNVLAVYNSGYGGNDGYSFKAYQWYRNYQPIEGATDNVLYLGDGVTFEIGDQVYVELTNLSGLTLPSCPLTIYSVPDYEVHTDNVPARKTLQNSRFVIIKGDDTYDIYGQKVK